MRAVDTAPEPARGRDEIAAAAVAMFEGCLDGAEKMFANAVRPNPRNTLTPFLRPVQWGVGGGVISVNAFDLGEDQALISFHNEALRSPLVLELTRRVMATATAP